MTVQSKAVLFFIAFLYGQLGMTQNYSTVKSVEISTTPDRSYVVNSFGKILPGVVISGTNGPFFLRANSSPLDYASLEQNSVRVEKVLVKGITNDNALSESTADKRVVSYDYFDGVGRSIQQLVVNASPTGGDIVTAVTYDDYGRKEKQYVPFNMPHNQAKLVKNAIDEQGRFFDNPPQAVVRDSKAYSEDLYDASPLDRVIKSYMPGEDWKTSNRSTRNIVRLNRETDNVLRWLNFQAGTPIVSTSNEGRYPVNQLIVSETIDEEETVSQTFSNVREQVILERRGNDGSWLDTYYVYSASGFLMFVFPPEAVSRLSNEYFNKSESEKEAFINKWAFQKRYDQKGRVTDKRIPGSDWVYMVYDQWDRLVLTQDGNQRATNQWTYTKYDIFNRPILTGFITGSRSTVEAAAKNVRFETRANNSIGYTNTSYPSHSESNLLTITYYDDYNFKTYTGWDAEGFSYNLIPESGIITSADVLTSTIKGYTTGSKVKNLTSSGTWLNTVTYYDKKYRVVQTLAENHMGGQDVVSNLYDFAGRERKAKRTHASSNGAVTVLEEYDYDHAGKLLTIHHSINGAEPVLMVSNKYNELGQLIEKNIHSTDAGASFLQSIDMRYNIQGWITHINNSTLTNDGVNNDDTNDLFGMEIVYNESLSMSNGSGGTFTSGKKYDGNISAIKWKTNTLEPGVTPAEKAYGFNYDVFKRFKQANYATQNTGNWNGNAGTYNEAVSYYDKNGNIGGSAAAALSRNGLSNGAKALIDNIAYRYDGNRLRNVQDLANNIMGFKDKTNALSVNEFNYDNSGNLTEDMNKNISSVVYNHLNMPTEITVTRADLSPVRLDKIKYVYDALGNKLSREVLLGGSTVWKTDYIGAIQYDNAKLSFLGVPEGRAVYNGSGYDYEYFYRDHQSNVRVVYAQVNETDTYRATMEVNLGTKETTQYGFRNITERRASGQNLTPPSADVLAPDRSALCNANAGKSVGPAKYLRVLAGDKVYLEAYARYTVATNSSAIITPAVLGAAVTGTFGITSGENPTLYNNMYSNAAAASGSIPVGTVQPKAYLAYLFFDDNNVFHFEKSGADGVTTTAFNAWQKLSGSATATQNGHLYMYVVSESNVSNANVYFDEFYVVHQKNNTALQVLQASDYYPYGLSFNEYNKERLKEVSPGVYEPQLRNRFLFQGQELQKDLDLGWYHYKYRMHDPAIGRFGGVDPLAEEYLYNGTYVFSENRLIDGIELEGAEFTKPSPQAMFYNEFGKVKTYGHTQSYWTHHATTGELMKMFARFVTDVSLHYGLATLGGTGGSNSKTFASRSLTNSFTKVETNSLAKTAFSEVADDVVQTTITSRFKSGSPAEMAMSWQGKGNYKGVDLWKNITLKEGEFIAGGLPGQSNYYTTLKGLERSNFSSETLWKGLQVSPKYNAESLYRPQIGLYRVNQNAPAAFGTTYANPQFGSGGLPQLYVPDYKNNLTLFKTIDLF